MAGRARRGGPVAGTAHGRAGVALAAANAGGLVAGALLDAAFGDPRRLHPVAGFGRAAAALERRMYAPDRAAGIRYETVAVGVPVVLAGAVSAATRRRPLLRAALVAATTWAVLGGTTLRREAATVADALDRGDLAGARQRLPHLCGRDPATLDEADLSRATVESVAENSSDAEVAPLVWGALAGLPGLVGYRAVNTLDAMVGHHSPRYENFGWASARADDVANYLPARLTAALTAVVAPVAGGRVRRALAVARADGRRHPSPNAGVAEAAFAGALGVRLGGRNDYGSHVEDRPVLGGDGRPPELADIARATRLSRAVTVAAAVAGAAIALARGWGH